MSYQITTNNHVRPIVEAWELTAQEREEFDYLDWSALEQGEDSRSFVRAYGNVYDLSDVMVAPASLKALGWHGFNADTYFSGIAFKYATDAYGDEGVIVARVYVTD